MKFSRAGSRIAYFLRFVGTNFREFEFQTLPLGKFFRGSLASSHPVFHVRSCIYKDYKQLWDVMLSCLFY